MSPSSQAHINELLLEREELFVRIHLAEKRAAELLGEAYPFERPALPSDQKTKRKPAASSRMKEQAASKALHLRPLDKGEACYRVHYQQWGREQVEEHRDAAALTLLLACQTGGLRVTCIESVDTAGRVLAVLQRA